MAAFVLLKEDIGEESPHIRRFCCRKRGRFNTVDSSLRRYSVQSGKRLSAAEGDDVMHPIAGDPPLSRAWSGHPL
jgi:hypothetical protein